MDVILLTNIKSLGKLGDTVKVKPGFGRNYLIPQKKAVSSTPANREYFEKRRADIEKNEQIAIQKAEERKAKLEALTAVISAQASDEGKLYGSIGANEVRKSLEDLGAEVSKREIVMAASFHSVGDYEIEIHLHSNVVATVKVQVVAA